MMALAHLFQRLHKLHQPEVMLPVARKPDERQHLKPQRLAIHLDRVAAHDPDFFHLFHALCRSRGRKPNSPRQLRYGKPRIVLQFLQQASPKTIHQVARPEGR